MSERHIATIHVYIEAGSYGEACDVLSESLRDLANDDGPRIIDWQYLKVGDQRMYPSQFVGDTPEEEYINDRSAD